MNAEWVVVAGASKGIGRASAHKLIDLGVSVVVSARNIELLKKEYHGGAGLKSNNGEFSAWYAEEWRSGDR